MIKLTTFNSGTRGPVVRIDGRLDRDTSAALADLLRSLDKGRASALDLSGLTSADAEGLTLLLTLQRTGIELRGGSLYITRLLEEARS